MRQHREHIPCDPERVCKLRETIGCYEDLHHEAWPRRAYRTKLERDFRNDVLNKVIICRAEHDDIHATTPPPQKPTVKQMREFLGYE